MGRVKELLFEQDDNEERRAVEAEVDAAWARADAKETKERLELERRWAAENPQEWAEWVRLHPLMETFCFAEGEYDFPDFLEEVKQRPSPGHTVERKDVSRGFGRGNLEWRATPAGPVVPTSTLTESGVVRELRRIRRALQPEESDKVDTRYIADKLGLKSTQGVTEIVKRGEIPKDCFVEGTGKGKPWKFHRRKIDRWLKTR